MIWHWKAKEVDPKPKVKPKRGEVGEYRICPIGATQWKVQHRWPITAVVNSTWNDCIKYSGRTLECVPLIRRFNTEKEAELWIDGEIERTNRKLDREYAVALRNFSVKPRRYP